MWSPLCRCLKALKAYKAIKGSLKVPSKYVVPNDVSIYIAPGGPVTQPMTRHVTYAYELRDTRALPLVT